MRWCRLLDTTIPANKAIHDFFQPIFPAAKISIIHVTNPVLFDLQYRYIYYYYCHQNQFKRLAEIQNLIQEIQINLCMCPLTKVKSRVFVPQYGFENLHRPN